MMLSKYGVLLEIQYLPSVQFFSLWKRMGLLMIEQHEHYSKGSFRNRTHIAAANGVTRLSIPLKKGKNEQQPIRETQIAWFEPWAKKHWQAIQSAYGNAPFFEFYQDELHPFFEKKYTYLFDWNLDLMLKLKALLGLEGELIFSQTYSKEPPTEILDRRNCISPKAKKRETEFRQVEYPQVFLEKHGFLPNLSILDLLFCTGPEAVVYL